MMLLILLLTAHFVGDFYIQPTRWVKCRNKRHIKSPGLWKHFGVHALLYSLVFILANTSWGVSITAIVLIAGSHLCIDVWKSYQKNNLLNFIIDQLLHIAIIISVWAIITDVSFQELNTFFSTILTPKHFIIAIAYMLVCKPASVVITLALKKHTDKLYGKAKDLSGKKQDKIEDMGLVSAGAWIGYIERCLAISFIFMGQFAAIGFLVATKTIFRFGDLTNGKDMKLTEYMLLGTLLSYAIALFVGWNTFQLYKIV